MISQLSIYEKSYCECDKCRQFCCSGKPGCLAPSDIDHIAEYCGKEYANKSFITANFVATTDGPPAATDAFPDRETPAMRPKTRSDGRCVFLGKDGRCTIHPVAPFECSRTMACDAADGAGAMKSLGKAIAKSADYIRLWLALWNHQERRGKNG